MRQLLILLFIGAGLGCGTGKKTTGTSNNLNGTWIPIQQELGGKQLPPVAFENYKLTVNDSVYTYGTPKIDKGVLTYANGKMDIYGREGTNTGKHYTAIYKLENGQLTICYNLAGTSYPEAFDTKGKPLYFLSLFKKE
jgi:uncharacterized protein (TIGR03067 family)